MDSTRRHANGALGTWRHLTGTGVCWFYLPVSSALVFVQRSPVDLRLVASALCPAR